MAEQEIKLPDIGKLVVSSSPHMHSGASVRRIMLLVIACLMPACVAGVVFFGARALLVLVVTTLAAMLFEVLFCKLYGRAQTVGDGSAALTGLLLGMNLSASVPLWVCVLGAFLAIGLGKQLYGGLGYNPFNPALVGRVALVIAFPKIMTTWMPTRFMTDVEAVTTATPLGVWQTDAVAGADYLAYFLGNIGGCIGETSTLALLLGALGLIAFRLIRWEVPVAIIGTVAVFTGIVYAVSPAGSQPTPLFHILTGGLWLGACFMATDMVTSPMSRLGALLFGIGCGIITCAIRIWGSYPEGMSFAILLMNALVPLIDRYTAHRPFGMIRKDVKAA